MSIAARRIADRSTADARGKRDPHRQFQRAMRVFDKAAARNKRGAMLVAYNAMFTARNAIKEMERAS